MAYFPIRSLTFLALAGLITACGNSSSNSAVDVMGTGGSPALGGNAASGGHSAVGGAPNGGSTVSNAGSSAGGNVSTGGAATSLTTIDTNPSTGGSSTSGGATTKAGTPTGGASLGGASTGGAGAGVTGGQQSTGTGGASVVAGGQGTGGTSALGTAGQTAAGGQATGGTSTWAPSAACVQKATTAANAMTPAQRYGQMTLVDSAALLTSVASSAFLGAVLSGGGTDPRSGTSYDNSVSAYASLISSYLNVAKSFSPHAGLLYGLDAIHGNDKVVNAVIFPHNIGLGATRNATLVQNIARITAQEMLGVGANWTFAPTIVAARDIRWGRTYEAFGSEPDLVAELGVAAVAGLQNGKLGSSQSVLACAKHFAGDGDTDGGQNTGDVTTMDEATFRTLAVDPYRPAIQQGVGSVMASYSSFQGAKMTDSKQWLTDVLKGELGFQGFVVTDWDAVG